MKLPRYRSPRPTNPLMNVQNAVAFTGVNGVPLGGIGAGCIELCPDGRLANFTTNNNYARSSRIEFMPGSWLGLAAGDGEQNGFRFLASASNLPLGPTGEKLLLSPSEIRYDGLYPLARVTCARDAFPVEVELLAHGPVVPGDSRTSCMPAATFRFRVTNRREKACWASIVFSWENIAGCLHGLFPDGRTEIRKIEEGGRIAGLEFHPPKVCRENQRGTHVLMVDAPAGAVASLARYNTWDTGALLAAIEDRGVFDADAWDKVWFAGSEHVGALACKVELAAGETKDVTFVLSWFYPDYRVAESERAGRSVGVCDIGHYYSNHYSSAQDVARAALRESSRIVGEIEAWHRSILESSLPQWLGRMLINNLYLTPATLWGKDGRYSLMETPYGPMMGTLDQRFYSSIATAMFFPDLEKTELRLFAETKHPEDRGRVYHDLGNLRFDDPKTGTTAKKWTDLNPKFVLMALRNYQWSGDRQELESLWPYMKEMMAYTLSQDSDGDGLPNNDDRSTTYDDWAFFGANSYASSLWLASIHAFDAMAKLLGKEADAEPYRAILAKATESFESKLWDEELGYYRLNNDETNPVFKLPEAEREAAARKTMADAAVNQGHVPDRAMGDHPQINRDCHDGQLAGQWYADALGLGAIVKEERIARAVREIARRNAAPHGMRKGVTPDGGESANPPSSAWWSEAGQGWPGYEVAHFAALAIGHGQVDAAMERVRRVYESVHLNAGLAFNQPLRWAVDGGYTYGWGCDRYMNSPAVWWVYWALLGLVLSRPERRIELRPRRLPMDAPLFAPGNWGRVRASASRIELSLQKPETFRTIVVSLPGSGAPRTNASGARIERRGADVIVTSDTGIEVGPKAIEISLD
jgi:non-lysosomal glucosylceramidase